MHGEFPTSAEDVLGLLHDVEPWIHDGHGDDGSLLDPEPEAA